MRWARPIVLLGSLLTAGVWAYMGHQPVAEPEASPHVVSPTTIPTVTREGDVSRSKRVALGVLFTLEVEGDEAVSRRALHAAMYLLDDLDRRWSDWRPGSDLWLVNARAGGAPVQVAARTAELLRESVAWSHRTDGLYQPTVGSRAAIQIEGERASLPHAHMRLSLGGLETDFAARKIMQVLIDHGVASAVVRWGDDVFARGEGSVLQSVAVVGNPRWPGQVVEHFEAKDAAAVTISDVRHALSSEGGPKAEIIDPRTGRPSDGCQSVTIVADDPVHARIQARVSFVLGAAAGLERVERQTGVEASIVDSAGRRHRSSSWHVVARQVPAHVPSGMLAEAYAAEPAPRAPLVRAESPSATLGPARVTLNRTEVTNAEYAKFLEATREDPHAFCHPREPAGQDHVPRYHRRFSPRLVAHGVAGALAPFRHDTFSRPDLPVVGVSFWDAWAYARWAGEHLPTREQWVHACAGPERRRWPWGNEWKPRAANTGGERDGERDGHTYAAASESFEAGASPAGCVNMAGNVAEWTADGWTVGGSSRSMPSGVTCDSGRRRDPGFRAFDLGFRTARGGSR